MVDCRAVYDKAVQENNKDMAQLIKDTSVVRSLPTTAQQAAIGKYLPPHMWSTNSLQPDWPPTLSTTDTAIWSFGSSTAATVLYTFPNSPSKHSIRKIYLCLAMLQMLDFQYLPLRNPWPGEGANRRPPRSHILLARRRPPLQELPLNAPESPILLARRRMSFQQEPLLQQKMTRHYSRR